MTFTYTRCIVCGCSLAAPEPHAPADVCSDHECRRMVFLVEAINRNTEALEQLHADKLSETRTSVAVRDYQNRDREKKGELL